MRIIKLDELPPERQVQWGNGISRRLLLQSDRMKYGLTDTIIEAGSTSYMQYTQHLEACYCIEGEGTVEGEDGVVHEIKPGVLYALEEHDKHVLKATTRMRLLCVFLPALIGNEEHQLLSGKYSSYPALGRVIFVETDPSFTEGIELVRKLNYSPIFFTHSSVYNPKYFDKEVLDMFDEVYDVDTHDVEAMYAVIRALKMNVKGVLANEDDMAMSASGLAKKLSLPHPDLKGLENAYSKDKVRGILKAQGVQQPEFVSLDIEGLNPETPPPMNYPFILKPTHDSGADGAFLCRSQDQYRNAVKNLQEKRFTFSGVKRHQILLEEFIDGNFYGAEVLWHQGSWMILGINRLFIEPMKSLCMTGISFPSDIGHDLLPSVEQEILRWLEILSLRGGALNVEFKLVDKRPVLIEINPRLAGGKVNELIQLSLEMSPVEYVIKQACGIQEDLSGIKAKEAKYFAVAYLFPPSAGEVVKIDTSKIDRTHLVKSVLRSVPMPIDTAEHSFLNIVGYMIASGKDCIDAMDHAQKIVDQIQLEVIPSS